MEIREQILAKLPKAANCHHLQTTDFQVIDNEPCEVVSENGQFEVLNPHSKEITFLAIDKCIFQDDSGHRKCDFAVFDDTDFVFVEIKDTTRGKIGKTTRKKHTHN